MPLGKCAKFLPNTEITLMKKSWLFTFLLSLAILSQYGMASRGQYDEEARAQERAEKEARKTERKNPVKNFAKGVKESTVDSTAGFVSETTEGASDSPVLGTIEGARKGTGKVLDSTVKGAYKVATLGYGDDPTYEVEEPESGTDEPTKIRIKIPGT
jgi:hypothetical protein